MPIATSFRRHQPNSSTFTQGCKDIHQLIDQIAILSAPPKQHTIYDLLVFFVQKIGINVVHQSIAKIKINIFVISKFLDEIPILETKLDCCFFSNGLGLAH
ncbi:Uncharacterised protein [Mycobacteroides abscessus subsp. abscessus]|nr:Uncharacterised protein [Mycobacteroides abscessus subsp. abscessus]